MKTLIIILALVLIGAGIFIFIFSPRENKILNLAIFVIIIIFVLLIGVIVSTFDNEIENTVSVKNNTYTASETSDLPESTTHTTNNYEVSTTYNNKVNQETYTETSVIGLIGMVLILLFGLFIICVIASGSLEDGAEIFLEILGALIELFGGG